MRKTDAKSSMRILLIGGAALIAIAGAALIVKIVKTNSVDFAGAAPVNKSRARLESAGAVLTGEPKEFYTAEFIPHFETASFRKASGAKDEDSVIAKSLIADSEELGRLRTLADTPHVAALPSRYDFVQKQSSVATKRASASVKTFIGEAITAGDADVAITGLEYLFALQQAVVPVGSEEALVFWFGANSELLRLSYKVSQMPGLDSPAKTRLLAVVSLEAPVMDVRSLAVRQASEMVAMARSVPDMDEDEIISLEIYADGNPIPRRYKERSFASAMESILIATWMDVIESPWGEGTPEDVGLAVDRMLIDRIEKAEPARAEFLVYAMPVFYEQYGRMVTRVLQGRAIMAGYLTGNLKDGVNQVTVSGTPITYNVRSVRNQLKVSSVGPGGSDHFSNLVGLEINQIGGVQLVLPVQ